MPDAIPTFSPADLYSNSTVALNPDTGKLAWYYQHLPGDDWDEDYTHERTLFRTAVSPDPNSSSGSTRTSAAASSAT